MKYCFLVWLVYLLLLAEKGHAAVRSVSATDRAISPIYLSLGRSTVLRFREKPRKVVLGNQNYFNIEFIESDLAIQPTGGVTTNLFVYGEFHTYGFTLHVGGSPADDLVHVSWAPPQEAGRSAPVSNTQVRVIEKQFSVGPTLQLRLERIVYLPSQNLIWGELSVLSQGGSPPSVKKISVGVFERGISEVKSRLVCESDVIKMAQKNSCRIFFPVSKARERTLKIKLDRASGQVSF